MFLYNGKTAKRLASWIVLGIYLIAGYFVASFCVEDVTYHTYFRDDLKAIKDNNEDVELIFIGASRLYLAMIPEIFEDKLEIENALVASTATQPISGTYYYLSELLNEFSPERVVIDVTWDRLINGYSAQPGLLVFDRLSPINKVRYAIDWFDRKDYCYFLKPCRYKDNVSNIKEIVSKKLDYKENGINRTEEAIEGEMYLEKGYVYSEKGYSAGNIPILIGTDYSFDEALILEKNIEYLDKCIELCKKKDVEVTLVTAPCSIPYMYFVNGYNEATEWYKKYADDKGISYYNLNYVLNRDEVLSDECAYDLYHVNNRGANVISNLLAEVLVNERAGRDSSYLFYDSLEALKADVHRAVSVGADIRFETTDDKCFANFFFEGYANDDVKKQYCVEMQYGEAPFEILIDWTEDEDVNVEVPSAEGITLLVRLKTGIEGEPEAYQYYYY